MSNTWFTSDQHYSHENVIKYCGRPFANAEEMNEELVRRHNALVSEKDTVFHLGDFSLSRSAVPLYLPRLKGRHILIAGNHDHVHPLHHKGKAERAANAEKLYRDAGFSDICLERVLTLPNVGPVIMHHMPYSNPESDLYDSRYKKSRPVDTGLWLLHGHIHERWKVKQPMINVGVDVWSFAPVSLDEIEGIIGQAKE